MTFAEDLYYQGMGLIWRGAKRVASDMIAQTFTVAITF